MLTVNAASGFGSGGGRVPGSGPEHNHAAASSGGSIGTNSGWSGTVGSSDLTILIDGSYPISPQGSGCGPSSGGACACEFDLDGEQYVDEIKIFTQTTDGGRMSNITCQTWNGSSFDTEGTPAPGSAVWCIATCTTNTKTTKIKISYSQSGGWSSISEVQAVGPEY